MTMGSDKFLIESIEHTYGDHKTWWKPGRMGYTTSVDHAGRYSEKEAREICERAGPDNERMWSEDKVYNGEAGTIMRVVLNNRL